jgi:hypothetical protein
MGNYSSHSLNDTKGVQHAGDPSSDTKKIPKNIFLRLPEITCKVMIEMLDIHDVVRLDTAMIHHEGRGALMDAYRGCVVRGGVFGAKLPARHGGEHLNGARRREYPNPEELCEGLEWAQRRGIVIRDFTLQMMECDHDIRDRDDHLYGLIDRQRRAMARLIITRCSTYDLNANDSRGYTPLTVATFKGEEDLVRLLCSRADVDINKLNGQGETALHRAAEFNTLACMQILLDAGADTSITSDVCPTALHTAVVWGNVEAAGLLLEAGAAASALSKWGRTPLDLLSDVDGDGTIPHAFQLRTLLLDKGGKHAAQVVNA